MERLYLSGEHFAQDHDRLVELGVTDIVACGCPSHHPDSFRYMEMHLRDSATSNVSRYLDPAADFIAQSLQNGGTVLVQCKAGICRSVTMVSAYLVKYQREMTPSVNDALAVIRRARRCANPRPEFMVALYQFQLYYDTITKEREQDGKR